MDKIILERQTLENILGSEAKKLVGKCMKRFELSENKEDIKKQVKEILYESIRDIQDLIIACSGKESIRLTNIDQKGKVL